MCRTAEILIIIFKPWITLLRLGNRTVTTDDLVFTCMYKEWSRDVCIKSDHVMYV